MNGNVKTIPLTPVRKQITSKKDGRWKILFHNEYIDKDMKIYIYKY